MSEHPKFNLLIVEDDPDLCAYLEDEYNERFHVSAVNSHQETLERLKKSAPDIVLLDLKLPENADDPEPSESVGYDLIKRIKKRSNRTHVIVMTAHYKDSETSVTAMKLGADDFIQKPFIKAAVSLDDKISQGVSRLVLIGSIPQAKGKTVPKHSSAPPSSATSALPSPQKTSDNNVKMKDIESLIKKIAKTDSTVLITGDTGVGKEYHARIIAEKSNHKSPFVVCDCTQLSGQLLESELFGHVKGAFTDAKTEKKGLVETAEGGTIFLDEIGELSLEMQVKFLRLLQNKSYRKVGATDEKIATVRIIAATNRNLEEMVENKTFRNDLYERLAVHVIRIPPLRERKDEIPKIARTLLKNILVKKKLGERSKRISQDLYENMKSYDWPRNVRELENALIRAVDTSGGVYLDVNFQK